MSEEMSGTVGGLGALIGSGLSARRAAKSNRIATRTAQNNTGSIRQFIPTNGYEVRAGTTGPSFVFGGQTGRITVDPNNPNGATSGAIQIGQIGTTPGAGTYYDPSKNQIFDGTTGKPIDAPFRMVEPGSSFLDINMPDYSSVFADANHAASSAGRLAGISEKLMGLADEFDILKGNADDLYAISDQAGELLPTVKEGSSKMREARMRELNDAESAARSDLTESVTRRKLAGSSFAEDTFSRQRAEFAKARGQADAATTLEEIAATTQILQFQSQVVNAAGERLNQALQGRLGAMSAAAQTEAAAAQAILGAGNLRLAALNSEFQSQVAALSLAFGGQEQAQQFIVSLLQLTNQATQLELGALGNQADFFGGMAAGLFNTATGGSAGEGFSKLVGMFG